MKFADSHLYLFTNMDRIYEYYASITLDHWYFLPAMRKREVS